MAPPRPSAASMSSPARRASMDFSPRFWAASRLQRIDSAAHRTHFHRHLIVGAAHTAAFDFDHGLYVLHRLAEHFERVLAALRLDRVEGVVDDVLRYRLLSAGHKDVDELGDVGVAVLRIGQDL